MLINIQPLLKYRQFRLLFIGQTISFFGSMMTYVAIPYQIYELTKSSFWVGLLGTVQLIPLVVAGLYGGALADTTDRRRLLIISEIILTIISLLTVMNCFLPQPSVVVLFVLAALSSVFVGIHRPAMEAITPQLVEKKDLASVAVLGSLRYSIGAVAGPALAGVLIATFGLASTYAIDAITYFVAVVSLWKMTTVAAPKAKDSAGVKSILNGFSYAVRQPVILGTYVVDIVAMIFAMPVALYPAMAEDWGGAYAVGWLYAALPLGAMLVTVFSGFINHYHRHGAGVILAAFFWGVFIIGLAFAPNLSWAVFLLAAAGAADAVSAIYRQTIWNHLIPTDFRGRLAGLNMLSYMTGPLLGNARAGFVASWSNNFVSILSGGILCAIGCGVLAFLLPAFWSYRANIEPLPQLER